MDGICPSCTRPLNEYKGCDLYTISKCGHVYHVKCLKNDIYRKKCTKCHIIYDPRQCHKVYLYPEQKTPSKGYEDVEYYEWFYCDSKTEYKDDEFSKFALKLGTDEKNNDIYAARVFLYYKIIPAYYIPATKMAIVSIGGKALQITEDIDVLEIASDTKNYYKWEEVDEHGQIPENAFNIAEISENALTLDETDENIENEKLYIISTEYKGKMCYGKFSSNENQAYIPYGENEIKIDKNYKILIRDTSTN